MGWPQARAAYCAMAMTGHRLEILPLSRHHWIVRYAGDTTPLSEHETRTDAVAEARNWARQFGEVEIDVHGLDGDIDVIPVDPDFEAPTPADVKGPHVEP
jgi:hypothetical protein